MKRVLFDIVMPLSVMVLWMSICYPVCNKADGFDYFLYWIMVGCPYGIRKMCMFLIPRNYGITGSTGVLALNCIVGGLAGGIVLIARVVKIFVEIFAMVTGFFWTACPKENR